MNETEVKINPRWSLSKNLEAGCTKEALMKYYGIETDAKWEKMMDSINEAKKKDLKRKMLWSEKRRK